MVTRKTLIRNYPTIVPQMQWRPHSTGSYLISSGGRKYVLVRCDIAAGKVRQWIQQLQYATQKGFVNFAEPLPSRSQRYTITTDSGTWFLRPHYPQLDLGRPENLRRAARLLASLHVCTVRKTDTDATFTTTTHGNVSESTWLQGTGGEVLIGDHQTLSPGSPYDDLADLLILGRQHLPAGNLGQLLTAYSSIFSLAVDGSLRSDSEPSPELHRENESKDECPAKEKRQIKMVRQHAREAFLRGHLQSEDSDDWEPPTQQDSERGSDDSSADTQPLQWVIPENTSDGRS